MTAVGPFRVPAPALFLVGGSSMYLGASLAVELFHRLDPAVVAWLRLLGAAVVLLAWRRPGRSAWRGRRVLVASALGLVTAVMNIAFYESIALLPMGTAVAVEFCGPVLVGAVSSRCPRDWLALALAATGVLLIADVRWAGRPAGVLWALGAALAWAGYIVLAKRVASGGAGVDDLAVGFGVAGVVLAPLALGAGPAWRDPGLLGLGLGVGLLSSLLPYVLDQVVLRRVGRARFALLLALLPVTAAAWGALVLGQRPAPVELLAIAVVVVAVALPSGADAAAPSGADAAAPSGADGAAPVGGDDLAPG